MCYNKFMLNEILLKNGIELSSSQIEKFEKYQKLILEYNARFNITGITDDEGITVKHFLDSLKGAKRFNKGEKIIEIGSGGGFPSVPLKIFNEDLDFTLVEATGKKCTFLNVVKSELNFENFKVLNARCEDLSKKEEYREKFDIVTARAVAPMSSLCEYCLPFLKVGGKFVAYKTGEESEIKDAERVGKILGARVKSVETYTLPENGERALIIMEKICQTDKKYPRGQGKERSKPL